MKKILILSGPEGHASLARSVRKVLGDDYEIDEGMIEVGEMGIYKMFYRFAPSIFGIVWDLGRKQKIREVYELYVDSLYRQKIEQLIDRFEFDLIITTYFIYLPFLAKLREKRRFKHINVVSDPVSITPIIYARAADYNVGFGDEFVKEGLKEGIEREKLVKVGWLVDKEFYQPLTERGREKVYWRWGLEREKRTVTVCGGSEGTNAVLKMLPILLASEWADRVQVVLVAGSNRWLKKTVEAMYELMVKSGRRVPQLKVVGFTRRMADLLRVSELVVGKAGPNLLFETVAARKPFVAIAHIEGQERGNLDLIRRYGLGWVAEKQGEFRKVFTRLMKDEKELGKFDGTIEAMARYNYQGLEKFRELVKEVLGE